MSELGTDLFASLAAALSVCRQHTCEHPAVDEYAAKIAGILKTCEDRVLNIAVGKTDLMLNGNTTPRNAHSRKIFLNLRRKEVGSIMISRGVTAPALKQFIAALALQGSDLPASYPGISIRFRESEAGSEPLSTEELVFEDASEIKRIFLGISSYREFDVVGLDSVAGRFIEYIRKKRNVLDLLVHTDEVSNFPSVHAANVALLSIFQAESLGFGKDILRDIGLAAILHDVGTISTGTDEAEYTQASHESRREETRKHPVYGPMLLSSFLDAPDIAIVSAFEHHMKYDGTGYPETKRRGKKGHLVSQIIAISDFFDSLHSGPLRKPLDLPVIAGLLHEAAGTYFNPQLVYHFLYSLREIAPASFAV